MNRKRIFNTILALTLTAVFAGAQVKVGIEVLRDSGFAALQGKRVGLITNPTGVDRDLNSTIDILHKAPGVELTALFSPEHGVRGDVYAGDHVGSYKDPATGVTVYSIFGKILKPTAEMLKDVDVLVYDIQDIGCRSYTFISTMGNAMEACAALGKKFMVLDRPNPVGGNKIEGCLVEPDCESFVSRFPIPYLYGMTPGELARYLNDEGLLHYGAKVDLEVVPMEGWTRDMPFDQTGQPWLLPSPHIPTAETALYYPASGILGDLYVVSIGVGYTLPFKLFAAPWVDAGALSARLDSISIPGVRFRPIHIKPFYSTYKGENISGVECYITDRNIAPLTLIQFYVMQELAAMYPDHNPLAISDAKRHAMFDKVCGSKEIRRRFSVKCRVDDMRSYWDKDVEPFRRASSRYYLYK